MARSLVVITTLAIMCIMTLIAIGESSNNVTADAIKERAALLEEVAK